MYDITCNNHTKQMDELFYIPWSNYTYLVPFLQFFSHFHWSNKNKILSLGPTMWSFCNVNQIDVKFSSGKAVTGRKWKRNTTGSTEITQHGTGLIREFRRSHALVVSGREIKVTHMLADRRPYLLCGLPPSLHPCLCFTDVNSVTFHACLSLTN
jgi:hypothetical protein